VLLNGSINGIDVERFRPADAQARAASRTDLGIPHEAFVIGFVGRVVRDKGIAELAAAWRMLREKFADLWLFVVGPIELEDPVPAEVLDSLRSDTRVILHGLDWQTPRLYPAMGPTRPAHLPGRISVHHPRSRRDGSPRRCHAHDRLYRCS